MTLQDAIAVLVDAAEQIEARREKITPVTTVSAAREIEQIAFGAINEFVQMLGSSHHAYRETLINFARTEDIIGYDLAMCALLVSSRVADSVICHVFIGDSDSMVGEDEPTMIRLSPCWLDEGQPVVGCYTDVFDGDVHQSE